MASALKEENCSMIRAILDRREWGLRINKKTTDSHPSSFNCFDVTGEPDGLAVPI